MNKRSIKVIFIVTSIALMLVLTSALAQTGEEVREEFHQTYPLASGGRVSLENINGSVHITAWDRNEVRVDAVKHAYNRERLNEAEINVNATSDSISIKTNYPDHTFRNDDGRYNNPASVEYTLSIPRNVRIDSVELINGSLDIEGVTGNVTASSINGTVRARGLTGEAKLSTINGRLEANFDRLDDSRSISLNSVNGPVVLTLPSDANAQIRANTLSGGINNDFGLPVRHGEYVGHDLAGVLGRGGARIKLGNVNGGITIHHASDGRTLSPATSLLSETDKDKSKNKDKDVYVDSEAGESEREARRAQVEAQREAARVQLDAQREVVRVQREVQRNQVQIQREAQREARRELEINKEEIKREAREMNQTKVYGDGGMRFVDRESKSFPVTGAPHVILKNFDGPIEVHSWDKPEVMYTALKRAGTDQELRGISMRTSQNGSDVTIMAEFDKAFARRIAPGVTNVNATVNLEVFVPRNTTLNVSSEDGRLHLEGISGDLQLHTGDGAIDVRDCSGSLQASTGDGRIRIATFDGNVDVKTGDGGITLEGRFTQLTARTGDGTITLAVPADFNATIETDAEDVVNDGLTLTEESDGSSKRLRRWRMGQGGNVLKLRTGEGRIMLRHSN